MSHQAANRNNYSYIMHIFSSLTFFDLKISTYIVSARNDFWNSFFNLVTWLGSWQVICLLFILISIVFYFYNKKFLITQLAIAVLGSGISTLIIKNLVGRARPGPDIALFVEKGASFPSAHAALSFALFGFLFYVITRFNISRNTKKAFSVFFISIIILVGFSRLYLGVHFMSDVLAGYIVGLIWILISVCISKSSIKQ